MQTVHLALVSELSETVLSMSELTSVSAALQKQLVGDVAPYWGISATVDAFVNLDNVPSTHWPIYICQDIGLGAIEGIHKDEADRQPFALVSFKDYWSLTASHEAIEMLIDPQGNRLMAGPSPRGDGQEVMFLVEVCDPVYSFDYAYIIDGYPVSDFCLPSFFGNAKASFYDMSGRVESPLQILAGGYICFKDPNDGLWWQWSKFSDTTEGEYESLGATPDLAAVDLRSWIDTKTPQRLKSLIPSEKRRETLKPREAIGKGNKLRADRLRKQISDLVTTAAQQEKKDQ